MDARRPAGPRPSRYSDRCEFREPEDLRRRVADIEPMATTSKMRRRRYFGSVPIRKEPPCRARMQSTRRHSRLAAAPSFSTSQRWV